MRFLSVIALTQFLNQSSCAENSASAVPIQPKILVPLYWYRVLRFIDCAFSASEITNETIIALSRAKLGHPKFDMHQRRSKLVLEFG
jgi:hypothetical protein